MDVFWDIAPCSLVDNDRSFGVAYCTYHKSDKLLVYSETSVSFYQTTLCNIPEDGRLRTHGRDNSRF
jgi:hypothetical protein